MKLAVIFLVVALAAVASAQAGTKLESRRANQASGPEDKKGKKEKQCDHKDDMDKEEGNEDASVEGEGRSEKQRDGRQNGRGGKRGSGQNEGSKGEKVYQ